MRSYMVKAGFASMLVAAGLQLLAGGGPSRSIASVDQLELHLQNAKLSTASRIKADDVKSLFVRLTFSNQHVVELAKDTPIGILKGEESLIDLKIPVKPAWIRGDELDFKIEFVSKGVLENVIIRCSHVSKEVTKFNRTLQCVLPGESQPFLNFRLAKQGEPVPAVARK